MELTDEDRAAIAARWIGVSDARSMQSAAEDTFRRGAAAMAERCAKACDEFAAIVYKDAERYRHLSNPSDFHRLLAKGNVVDDCAVICRDLARGS